MANEPIHEIRFLKYLANKFGKEVTTVNRMLTNEQLNGICGDVEILIQKIEEIENNANVFHQQYGSAITI